MYYNKPKFEYILSFLEEGISYYLTFRWSFVLIAALISIFPTFLINRLLIPISWIKMDWGEIFFLLWLLVLTALIYEFKLPSDVRKKLKEKKHSSAQAKNVSRL